MKKYKTSSLYYGIKIVEVVRETASSVWTPGWKGGKPQQWRKVSSYDVYHDTYEGARERLVAMAHKELERASRNLTNAQEQLKKTLDIPEEEI